MNYILLPAFNEKKNLIKVFDKIEKICVKNKNIIVVLVDDCSSDNTHLLKKRKYKFKLIYTKHKKNMGLSITLETGFKLILQKNKGRKKDIVITLDSDNTHPISIIPTMIKKINTGKDIIVASRFVKSSKVKGLSVGRQFLSIGAKYLFKSFYPHKNLKDYTCNFRAYKFQLIIDILKKRSFFKNEDFNIAAKIIIFLIKKYENLNILEIPFTLSYNYKIGASKMKLIKTILLTLRLLFSKSFK